MVSIFLSTYALCAHTRGQAGPKRRLESYKCGARELMCTSSNPVLRKGCNYSAEVMGIREKDRPSHGVEGKVVVLEKPVTFHPTLGFFPYP